MSELTLKARVDHDFKAAMKARDTRKKDALTLLRSAIKQREVDERITLDDTQVLAVITSQIKQRKGSIEQYKNAQREDLANQEQFEIDVMSTYLPAALSEAEIAEAVSAAVAQVKPTGMQDMGKVMALLKPKLQGRADLSAVSQQVRSLLNQ